MSPYAEKLRDHLLSLPPEKHPGLPRVQALLGLHPPDFTGAADVWVKIATGWTSAIPQVKQWIQGRGNCRRPEYQPPGYTPPPKRNGRAVQVREWHSAAGSAPDGVVAAAHGVSLAAVISYRRRAGIPAFKPTKPSGQE